MKKIIKRISNKIFSIFPLKNIIIMESNPDFTDSVKKVFDELIKNKINDKYKIIWFVNESKKIKNIRIKNVKFVDIYPPKYNILKMVIKLYYNHSAKIIIDSNKFVNKKKKEQKRVHIQHGAPLKNISNYSNQIGDVDYIIELSEFFKEKNEILYSVDKNKFLDLGLPRNDDLLKKIDKKQFFPEYENKKIIIWLPTYREHSSKINKQTLLVYGIPCFNNKKDFETIDKILEENNTTILLKLHPAQDKKNIESFKNNNIKIISDDELIEKGINLYELLAMSDALITDYSSVYYDYLLTNKQIGLAISDIKEFEQKYGFIYNYYETLKGQYIYDIEQLIEFIEDVSTNDDVYIKERRKAFNMYHDFTDNKATKRVFNIIKEYL